MSITVFAESPPHGYQLIQLLHSMNLDNSLTVVMIPRRQLQVHHPVFRSLVLGLDQWMGGMPFRLHINT